MGALAFALGVLDVELMILVSVVAFIGAIFDSMLGSLLQIKYKCRLCGEITEREVHCGKRTERLSGFYFFDNDVVNLFSGAFAAILVAVIYTLIC